LFWCAGLLAVGVVLYAAEKIFGNKGTAATAPPLEK
jgi:hypothetical protein